MYRLLVALRYLVHKRISVLAMLGVAVGVMVLFIVHSVMTGFDQDIRSRIRGNLADLIIERDTGPRNFGDYEALLQRIQKIKHVTSCSPRLEGLGLVRLTFDNGPRRQEEFRWVEFVGVDLERECATSRLAEYWLAAQEEERKSNGDHQIVPQPAWGNPDPKGRIPVIVGEELVVVGRTDQGKQVALGAGEKFALVTLVGAAERNARTCVIAGKFRSAMFEYDSRNLYMPLKEAQAFLEDANMINAINVRLDDYAYADEVRAAILGIPAYQDMLKLKALLVSLEREVGGIDKARLAETFDSLASYYDLWRQRSNPTYPAYCRALFDALALRIELLDKEGDIATFSQRDALKAFIRDLREVEKGGIGVGFRASTWEDKQRTILRAVSIERKITVIVQSFIFLLAWFGIYSILSSLVLEKTKDIGILKSLGATVGGILSIFMIIGLAIGVIGSALGIVGGIYFCKYINEIAAVVERFTGLNVFPPDVYYLDRIPVDRDPFAWAITLVCIAVAVSLLAGVRPGLKAARMNPVDALRYE
jgi:lipoprotein-releasing system permease protein